MTYNRRALIIIPSADKNAANQAALAFDSTGGLNTFTVGLSANGQEPASHFWASIQFREQTFQAVQAIITSQFSSAVMVEYNQDTEPNKPAQVLAEVGLQTISTDLI
jgi:hypothetical protein